MISTDRIREARDLVATMTVDDPVYAVIFDRLDREVIAREANDPVSRARALAAQRGTA